MPRRADAPNLTPSFPVPFTVIAGLTRNPEGWRVTRGNKITQPPRPVILASRQYPQGGELALIGMERHRCVSWDLTWIGM